MMREPAFQQLPRPAPTPLVGRRVLVLGLGDTGLSVARWVEREGGKVRLADTRASPPRKGEFGGELHLGAFHASSVAGFWVGLLTPGLSLADAPARVVAQKNLTVGG